MSRKPIKFNYDRVKERIWYDILRPLGHIVSRFFFKVKYVGKENIPENGGLILAANHIHAIDPLIIAMGMDHRQMHFMAKRELFENKLAGKFIGIVNAFPIVRGGADTRALDYAKRIPQEGYVLGIFVEGTRSPDGTPQKAKKGVASIANAAHCPVIPVSVYNNEGVVKHTKYTVRFGKPIPYSELNLSDDPSREELGVAADYVMSKITELWEEGHCE